mmetsp:Transcript_1832/g.5324  ORF Transcript_1832/g.5324 Transcript_1832/m.5324 type:complete len:239 (+) Transcript_1832:374-1090(+)
MGAVLDTLRGVEKQPTCWMEAVPDLPVGLHRIQDLFVALGVQLEVLWQIVPKPLLQLPRIALHADGVLWGATADKLLKELLPCGDDLLRLIKEVYPVYVLPRSHQRRAEPLQEFLWFGCDVSQQSQARAFLVCTGAKLYCLFPIAFRRKDRQVVSTLMIEHQPMGVALMPGLKHDIHACHWPWRCPAPLRLLGQSLASLLHSFRDLHQRHLTKTSSRDRLSSGGAVDMFLCMPEIKRS